MRCTKLFSILASLAIAGFWLVPAAKAGKWSELTKLTFSEPVEVPGHVLPAGSYWFQLLNLPSSRNVVEIYSSDWSKFYGAMVTSPDVRTQHIGRTELRLAERPHNRPEAVLAWFYPGAMTGHEFLYPHQREVRFNHDAKQDILIPALMSRASAP